jgi:aminopeptidase N
VKITYHLRNRWYFWIFLMTITAFVSIIQAQDPVHFAFEKSALAELQATNRTSATVLNENPLLNSYDVKFYGLDVEVNNRTDQIQGSATILVEVMKDSFDTLVFELNQSLTVGRVVVDGVEASYTQAGDELYINMVSRKDSGALVSTQVFYGTSTGAGMVREQDDEWGAMVTYSNSEPFYSKDWFPCKQVLSDKADSVHVYITTDYGLMGVSNGILTGTTYFPDGKVRYEWKSNYPIAYYLICIAVADYIEYDLEVQPQGLTSPIFIQNFVYDLPGCLDTYREQINVTGPIMEVFCDHFGPYPFREEKYGHYLWPWGGGMENQTLTGVGNFEFYLIAHELGHSWFGDYVTCATWQDIWINEGFATFAGYLATEVLGPDYADDEREMRFESAMLYPDGTVYVPFEDIGNDARIFSGSLSYNKGMALLYMIRYELQDDALFYLALRNYIDRYSNGVATGMDFKEVLEETSGMDFTDFFDQWYFGAGYPIYDVTWEQVNDTLTIHSSQSTSSTLTPLFKMSMEYRILYPGGDTTVRVFQGASEETYRFDIHYEVTGVEVDPFNHVLDGENSMVKHIEGAPGEELISVTPNPNDGNFLFRLKDEPFVSSGNPVVVEVVDLAGKLCYRHSFPRCLPYMDYEIRLDNPGRGIFIVRFRYAGRIEVKKIMVR